MQILSVFVAVVLALLPNFTGMLDNGESGEISASCFSRYQENELIGSQAMLLCVVADEADPITLSRLPEGEP